MSNGNSPSIIGLPMVFRDIIYKSKSVYCDQLSLTIQTPSITGTILRKSYCVIGLPDITGCGHIIGRYTFNIVKTIIFEQICRIGFCKS